MKARVIKLREGGAPLEQGAWKQAIVYKGEMEIFDTRENNLNRISKVARLECDRYTIMLHDVHVVWLTDNKMGLTGFERKPVDGRDIDYAQTWLCLLHGAEGWDNENMRPPRENFRH